MRAENTIRNSVYLDEDCGARGSNGTQQVRMYVGPFDDAAGISTF